MHLLIITHDDIATLDRRIVNEARVFVEHGWTVQVNLTTQGLDPVSRILEPGILLNAMPLGRFPAPYDPLYHAEIEIAPTSEPAGPAPRRSLWRRFLRRLNYHLAGVAPAGPARWVARNLFAPLARQTQSQLRYHLAPYPRVRRFGRSSLVRCRTGLTRLRHPRGLPVSVQQAACWYPLPFTDGFRAQAANARCDAVMACDLPALPAAHEVACRLGVPLIYDSHEHYTEQAVFTRRQKFVLEEHERRCLRDADLVITVSDPIAADMRQKYGLSRPVEVLYNAPSFQAARGGERSGVRERLGIPADAPLVLYHGGIVRNRNLERMVREFARLGADDAWLVLLGYGDATESLRKLAADCGRGRVIVHDAVPQDKLPEWINDADAVIIPYPATEKNNEFCMPNKFSDCIELGCPVIANSSLVAVSDTIRRFDLGITGRMETDAEMRAALGEALKWLRAGVTQGADFEAARRLLGWDAQREKLCAWLSRLGLPGFAVSAAADVARRRIG